MANRALRILTIVAAMAALIPASAFADADPASDVLLGENVFYPYSPTVSAGLQGSLESAVTAAHRAGFPIKVALVRAPGDLGGLPGLFNKPQDYADFLYRELGSFYGQHQPLLIVMPDGNGVSGMGDAVARAASLPKPTTNQSDELARAAITGVERLSADVGHPIRITSRPAAAVNNGGHVSTALAVVIFGLVAVAIAGGVIRYRHTQADIR